MAVHDLIKRYASEHQRIVFSGNGYSEEWVKEAERRGLPHIRTMVDAIPVLTDDKTVNLFEKFGVFTRAELESRAEIQYETYAKAINIEARAMIDIAASILFRLCFSTRRLWLLRLIRSAPPALRQISVYRQSF